jgi:hypothetical protein
MKLIHQKKFIEFAIIAMLVSLCAANAGRSMDQWQKTGLNSAELPFTNVPPGNQNEAATPPIVINPDANSPTNSTSSLMHEITSLFAVF